MSATLVARGLSGGHGHRVLFEGLDVTVAPGDVVGVIGGLLAEAGEMLRAGVRESIYRRSLPLATENLRIVASGTGETAGALGAAAMVVRHVLSPEVLDARLGEVAAAAQVHRTFGG